LTLSRPHPEPVLELFWEADDDVPVLANVLVIGEEGENIDEFRPADSGGTSTPEPVATSTSDTNIPAVETTAQPQETIAQSVGTVTAPSAGISPRARKKAMHAGVDAEILVGTGPGGRVIERDVDAFLSGVTSLICCGPRACSGWNGSPETWIGDSGNGIGIRHARAGCN
jgi:pyruvate dehydrogenase E2 component (dihydrolipoamide acetyltransferase)